MSECITHQELQHLLNQFQGLEGLAVEGQMPNILTPDVPATIRGAVLVHGEHYVYELTVNLRKFKNADDVLGLVDKLHKAFDGIKGQVNV